MIPTNQFCFHIENRCRNTSHSQLNSYWKFLTWIISSLYPEFQRHFCAKWIEVWYFCFYQRYVCNKENQIRRMYFLSIIKNWDKDIMLQLLHAYRKKIMLSSCWRCLLEIKTVLQLFQMPKAIYAIHSFFYILIFWSFSINSENVNLLKFFQDLF